MSQQLGLNVVAEGVETKEQLRFLRRHNCNHVQGYIFSKPLSAEDFLEFLASIAGSAPTADEQTQATA